MKDIYIRKDIIYVGAIDAERRIFDELISLPDGQAITAIL